MTCLKKARKLAKTHEYQLLYTGAKEYGFKIFENDRDFSAIQQYFLGFLNFYATISLDIYLGEIDERVLENEVYEDAYSYYKSKDRDRKRREAENKQINHSNSSSKGIEKLNQTQSTWKFRRPKQ